MNTKKYISLVVALAAIGSLALAIPAFAQTAPTTGGRGGMMGRGGTPGIFGTVSAINGDTLTVNGSKGFGSNATNTTYTVDATNAKVTKSNATGAVSAIAVGDKVMVQGKINGTSVTATNIRDGVMPNGGARAGMGVAGTVSAINGTSLTVTSKGRPTGSSATATPITYTVDASSSTVTKNGTASSLSSIAVGDTVMVQGTVSGTSVTAKTIRDGVSQAQPVIQGNGQPVVAGSVTALSGNTITITNKSNVTYTIDAINSKFVETGVTNPTISNIAVGDNVIVQGTVNGNSVTASSVIDQKAKVNNGSNNTAKNQSDFMGGIMGGIGSFFKHLFGF